MIAGAQWRNQILTIVTSPKKLDWEIGVEERRAIYMGSSVFCPDGNSERQKVEGRRQKLKKR
jgi:hypothetical protein